MATKTDARTNARTDAERSAPTKGLQTQDLYWIWTLAGAMTLGLGAIVLFTTTVPNTGGRWASAAAAFLLAGACLLSGGLVGFLFGIPRALQNDEEERDDSGRSRYRANTNLEQISDWLTKILVGVGLTQLGALPGWVAGIAERWRDPLGGSALAEVFVLVLLVYFLTCGFLFGYLWTRLFLLGALTRADLGAVLQTFRDQIETQQERDVASFGVVYGHLQPDAEGPPEASEEEVSRAVLEASPTIRAQVFSLAVKARKEGYRNPELRHLVERTIPVFDALVESQGDQGSHTYLGQLAYSLKDQAHPDWEAATRKLDEAIRRRGPWRRHGYVIYEANRAQCRIHLDAAFARNEPSAPDERRRIVEDLRAASTWKITHEWLAQPPFAEWLALNKISEDELAV